MKAVIFTGSRDYSDWGKVTKTLHKYPKGTIIIHGAAKGLDSIAGQIAEAYVCKTISMPAQWNELGKAAGPKRNQEMLNVLLALGNCGYEIYVEAFPLELSIGTYDMIKRSKQAGVEVNIHN